MGVIGWIFVITAMGLGLNTFFFITHIMGYIRNEYRMPYKAHGYALKLMFIFAIPGLFNDDDDGPIWRRLQEHIDSQRNNAAEIAAERRFLAGLRTGPDTEEVRRQIAESVVRLETLRLMDINRHSAVFLATRAADIAQQQQRLADAIRAEQVALGIDPDTPAEVTPASPSPPVTRWRRVVQALLD